MSLILCPECRKEISSEAAMCPHCGFPLKKNDSEESVHPDIDAALKQGKKIQAIKIYREDKKVDLKTAKEYVDALVEKNPDIYPNYSGNAGCAGGAAKMLLFLGVITSTAVTVISSL